MKQVLGENESQERVEMAVAGHPPAQSRRTKGTKGREAEFPVRHWCMDDKGEGCRKRKPGLERSGYGRVWKGKEWAIGRCEDQGSFLCEAPCPQRSVL